MQVPQVPILARSLFAVAVSPVSSCPSKLGLVLSPSGVVTPALCKEPWNLCMRVNPCRYCLQISFQLWESWRTVSGC